MITDTNTNIAEEIIETVEVCTTADEESIEVYTEEELNTFEIMTFDELRAMIFGRLYK